MPDCVPGISELNINFFPGILCPRAAKPWLPGMNKDAPAVDSAGEHYLWKKALLKSHFAPYLSISSRKPVRKSLRFS